MLRRLLIAGAGAALLLAPGMARAQDLRLGALLEITGPIASAVPPIQKAAEFAIQHVNDQGGLLGRRAALALVDGQGTPQGAVDAASRLANVEQVPVIVGPLMSGSLIAAANSVTAAARVTVISPSATSPRITDLQDNDTVFRTAPSDSYQGRVMAEVARMRNINNVAVMFLNSDYGVGLANAFRAAFTAAGGRISYFEAHETKKTSFRSELAAAAQGRPQALVMVALPDDTGTPILRQALEAGLFDSFILAEGMRIPRTIQDIGAQNLTKAYFTAPIAPEGAARDRFRQLFTAAGQNPDALFAASMYDSTFIAALAIQAAGSADRAAVNRAMRAVTQPGGEEILPGEWQKARAALAAGRRITYVGATGPKPFDAAGDTPGSFGEFEVKGNDFALTRAIRLN
jgi:branched-chain amino acid transport system substrate-binding protein